MMSLRNTSESDDQMIIDEPYFMTNEDWYYFDANEGIYKIQDSAPKKAKESYEEFYEILKWR